jgi:DNA-binding response OmpR family regulator
MNIAICDDDIEFCTTLKRQLTDCLQYNDIIDIYYSGEMFLAGCKKCNYDAVFLDLYMGGMTGFETAEKLAHCGKETDIIFLNSGSPAS